jgi:hypothetical protein
MSCLTVLAGNCRIDDSSVIVPLSDIAQKAFTSKNYNQKIQAVLKFNFSLKVKLSRASIFFLVLG